MIYLKQIRNIHTRTADSTYPYTIPSLLHLKELTFEKDVTFIIGENGTGKSTLMEAIAINLGFNPEGGGRNFNFSTAETHSELFNELKMVRSHHRNKDGYFMRAESFYNVASEVDSIARTPGGGGILASYGGKSLHERSHGESFLSLFRDRLFGTGLYIFDEPEAALSITSIFSMMVRMQDLVVNDSQFIIATHSPILLAYPNAAIYSISENGFEKVNYEETEQYKLTRFFLENHEMMMREILDK